MMTPDQIIEAIVAHAVAKAAAGGITEPGPQYAYVAGCLKFELAEALAAAPEYAAQRAGELAASAERTPSAAGPPA